MTLTYFKARSTWVAYVFEWVDLLKCHLKGETCRILANGQDIDYPERKKNGPRPSLNDSLFAVLLPINFSVGR